MNPPPSHPQRQDSGAWSCPLDNFLTRSKCECHHQYGKGRFQRKNRKPIYQRDWKQEKNCLNTLILKKDDAIIRKYQWNHRFLCILSKNFDFWTQTNPNNMIGERLSKNSCDWVASVCFYRKQQIITKKGQITGDSAEELKELRIK